MDAAGKDGTIKHVMSGREPPGLPGLQLQAALGRGTRPQLPLAVHAVPARAGADRHLQPVVLRGRPGREGPPRAARPPATSRADGREEFWSERYQDINAFERHLVRNGTVDPQVLPERLQGGAEAAVPRAARPARTSTGSSPRPTWPSGPTGADYMRAYADCLSATSTKWAPWYVIPADHKWVTRASSSRILVSAIEKLDLRYPESRPSNKRRLKWPRSSLRRRGLGSVAISAIFRRIAHTPSSRPSQWGQPGRVLCPAHPPPAPSSEHVAAPCPPPLTPLRRSAWRCPSTPPTPPSQGGV